MIINKTLQSINAIKGIQIQILSKVTIFKFSKVEVNWWSDRQLKK